MALEEDNLRLSKEELEFYKQQLGMEDEAEIKDHIIEVGTRAHKVRAQCIQLRLHFFVPLRQVWTFNALLDQTDTRPNYRTLRLKSQAYDSEEFDPDRTYRRALESCIQREDGLYVDFGCCFGADLRKAVVDGLPVQKAIGSDIRREFWGLGHELFKSTPETFPATFIPGDAFDKSFISGRGPCAEAPTGSLPDLKTLTSFIPLQGRVTAIHVANVFHLFSKEKQVELAQALSSLLSPVPGSVIFGSQAGKEVPGEYTNRRGETSFAHSPESWKELWDGGVFPAGSIRVKTKLYPIPFAQKFGIEYALFWSCTVV
ncbi:hypothetical protein PM082_010513 [Marasmius tenuissimus]|nr:hypothetical protein PM082_010513 [Marasmius tenuissimus]